MKYAGRFNSLVFKGQDVLSAIDLFRQVRSITHLEFNYPEHFAGYDLEEIKAHIKEEEENETEEEEEDGS